MNSKPDTEIISAFKKTIEQELYGSSVSIMNKFCGMFEEEIMHRRNAIISSILDSIAITVNYEQTSDMMNFQINLSSSPAKELKLKKQIIALEAEIEELQEENAELRQACEGSGCPRSNY